MGKYMTAKQAEGFIRDALAADLIRLRMGTFGCNTSQTTTPSGCAQCALFLGCGGQPELLYVTGGSDRIEGQITYLTEVAEPPIREEDLAQLEAGFEERVYVSNTMYVNTDLFLPLGSAFYRLGIKLRRERVAGMLP